MASIRLLSGLLALPLIVACGGGGGEDVPDPVGPHYPMVANKLLVPTNNNQAREYGLDLNKDKTVDNQLGMVLGTLAGQGFDVQGTIDKAIAEASIILLFDFQTESFMSSGAAGLQVKLGDMETPLACNAGEEFLCKLGNGMECKSTDTGCTCAGCGHHLNGAGTFTIDANSPMDAGVAGKIASGTFNGGPGDITLKIALGSAEGIELDLIGARAKASGISADGMQSVILAGALTKSDLDGKVIPAIHAQIGPLVTRDCTLPNPPTDCGCTGTGKTILGLFDTMPKDCMVTVDEIKNNTLIQSLLAPDVKIDGKDALSLGIKATAVKASFPTPTM